MDPYVKLSKDAIKYYLKTKSYLTDFDDYFKNKNNGVRVEVKNEGRLKGISGSLFPTKENLGLDIVFESINAGFFDLSFNPITQDNLDKLDITVYEFTEVEKFTFVENFDNFHGIMINFLDQDHYVLRKDFSSDMDMLKKALELANVDSWDNFSIDKFKLKIHK